jgi:hypothetical protein
MIINVVNAKCSNGMNRKCPCDLARRLPMYPYISMKPAAYSQLVYLHTSGLHTSFGGFKMLYHPYTYDVANTADKREDD